MSTPEENAQAAATRASELGWAVTTFNEQFLLAINPDDSSEIWMFFHADNVWRRKGDSEAAELRSIWWDNARGSG